MKLPEYLLSTPRLILVILTIALVAFTGLWLIEPLDFKDICLLVFGYFFGSRWKEESKPNDVKQEPLQEKRASPELEFINNKYNNDGSN